MTANGKKRLGDILVEQSIITRKELESIIATQKNTNMRLGEILIKRGIATEDVVLGALSVHYGIKFQSRLEFNDPKDILTKVPVHFMTRNRLVPFNVIKKLIIVGITDPLNIHPFDDLKIFFPEFSFETVLSTEEEITRVITEHFEKSSEASARDALEDIEDSDFDMLSGPSSETENILDMANEAPIIKLVNTIISQAVEKRASDIHIEPYENDLIVRYRIDGILYKMLTPPKKLQGAVISRIKIMSSLNIAENRLPQDGRIQLKVGKKDIDIRVSVFPTHFGERIVLRLLNKSDISFSLDSIGFEKKMLEQFKDLISKPHGIILVTGPTGSGKSTTLYSSLVLLNKPDVNILTVEDPIEYQLQGIGQMQVKPKIDLTFANGLRSILRQDPDIIMVGEIRDTETAEIAIQSALTGHLVFSTLHTNDAASGITRLIDMGIEPFLIASSVNAFLAQRLVRLICPKCRKQFKPTHNELRHLPIKSVPKNAKFWYGKGCDHCLNTGYIGRSAIYELLPVTNDIRKLIINRSDSAQIKQLAVREGMITLLQNGLQKVFAGHTTLDEVIRVSGV
jgi:general secretion pathway protein E